MEQTEKVKCPHCQVVQEEDIHDLASDTGDMEGSFKCECESCGDEFTVEFEYKSYLKTY